MFRREISRRQFLKTSGATVAGLVLSSKLGFVRVLADAAAASLSDPVVQPKFVNTVPDALSPGFIFQPNAKGVYNIVLQQTSQQTGLVNKNGEILSTTVWGYGTETDFVSWPGRTFQVQSGSEDTIVKWDNQLYGKNDKPLPHLLPVDTSLHWAYSLPGYQQYSIKKNGVPIITHLHGGHTDYKFDGNPEFFYSPNYEIEGPQWEPLGGVIREFQYDNDVPAGNLWYHDHALGITRLNVYAGLAGFYFVRDKFDTGLPDNNLRLPAWPYEKAYAIQDRMFTDRGELFYPAYPGDPYYEGFITEEGALLPPNIFRGGGPTALAEFFGDHMVVNGLIWPKEDVEPRNYRMHLLNGTDSRFMAIRFREIEAGAITIPNDAPILPFWVVGSDQGLAFKATMISDYLLCEPGSRYDVVVDFSQVDFGKRVIMENIGGDEPFGGDIPGPQLYADTDKIMAFDVTLVKSSVEDKFNPAIITGSYVPNSTPAARTRKVALFEGMDEFGRLQPLLGTAEPATDWNNQPIYWPDKPEYADVGLLPTQQMEGSIAWHSPTTENPELGATEEWEIWNVTGDAHPVHLHLVHFDILEREGIKWDTATGDGESDFGRVADPIGMPGSPEPAEDGTYLVVQPTVQHNSVAGQADTYGMGFKIMNPMTTGVIMETPPAGYVENAPKDMVTALPDQVTRIKATFDKPGRYVWHCHILSHEDHEMMRVMHVGPGA